MLHVSNKNKLKHYKQITVFGGYNVCLSTGRSDARGTAILLNNNFEHNFKNELKDED